MSILNINFNLLKTFWAVYKTGGINRAAKMLGIAPPAVTYNIKQLEKQIDKKLFITTKKGTEHTGEASSLYILVESAIENLLKYDNELNATNKGTIRIGLTTMHASFWLVKFTQEFRKKHPDLKIEFFHHPQHDYLTMLENDEIDVALFQFNRKPTKPINIFELMTKQMTFFTTKQFASKHNLTDEITLERFLQLPFVLFSFKEKSTLIQLENVYGKISNVIDAPSTHTAYAMVMDGQGIGYFFEDYLDAQKNDQIVKLKIKDMPPPPPRVYECAYYKKPSNLVSLFIKDLKEFYSEN